ncbi:hypothetical protein VP01_3042g1 [Puccinia sorghi]|uniref:Uncharacterized protein n=1 Tax=Puccinia sorghi TaxID=27349 RepID=A0A0L6UZZ7_9BASI|nr:hypothetical protein VP01_3042g1 [Puccinia sorghi]
MLFLNESANKHSVSLPFAHCHPERDYGCSALSIDYRYKSLYFPFFTLACLIFLHAPCCQRQPGFNPLLPPPPPPITFSSKLPLQHHSHPSLPCTINFSAVHTFQQLSFPIPCYQSHPDAPCTNCSRTHFQCSFCPWRACWEVSFFVPDSETISVDSSASTPSRLHSNTPRTLLPQITTRDQMTPKTEHRNYTIIAKWKAALLAWAMHHINIGQDLAQPAPGTPTPPTISGPRLNSGLTSPSTYLTGSPLAAIPAPSPTASGITIPTPDPGQKRTLVDILQQISIAPPPHSTPASSPQSLSTEKFHLFIFFHFLIFHLLYLFPPI